MEIPIPKATGAKIMTLSTAPHHALPSTAMAYEKTCRVIMSHPHDKSFAHPGQNMINPAQSLQKL